MPVPNPRKRPFDGGVPGMMRGGFRGGFRGRGGGRGGRMPPPQLAVRNIPPHVNNIAHLNNHFARFGTLVNVQVRHWIDLQLLLKQKNLLSVDR